MGWSGTSWQVTSNRLVVKEGGGCLGIFGLPFFGAGVFLVLVGLGVVPMENAAEVPTLAWPVLVAMGLVFAGVGGGLAFGRRWTTVDAGRGLILKEWGPLVPVRTQEHRTAGYDTVLLLLRPGDSDSPDSFDVLLRGRRGNEEVSLSSSSFYGESRELAVAAAKLLGFPLVDASTPRETVLDPHLADRAINERAPGDERSLATPPRPSRMRSQVRESAWATEIFLPQPAFRLRSLMGPVLAVGALAYFGPRLLDFFRETGTPGSVQLAFMAFLGFLFFLLPLLGVLHGVLLSARGGTLVTASREGIAVEERGALRRRVRRIPSSDILDLDHGASDAVVASAVLEAEARAAWSDRSSRGSGTTRGIGSSRGEESSRGSGTTRGIGSSRGEESSRATGFGQGLPPRYPEAAEPGWVSFLRRIVPSQGVVVKTRSDLVTFGADLPDPEVRYLHALVVRALRGGA